LKEPKRVSFSLLIIVTFGLPTGLRMLEAVVMSNNLFVKSFVLAKSAKFTSRGTYLTFTVKDYPPRSVRELLVFLAMNIFL